MTENIKQVILDFLQRKSVDYSMLINGVWGAGKTYFVNNSLSDVFDQAKLSPIYVSLNGINSFEEVAAQIVFGTNWNTTKHAAKSFLLPFALKYLPEKSVSALISLTQKMSEKKSSGWFGWLKTKNDLSPKNHVIILDDLERVNEPDKNLAPIMGRIFDEFISKGYHIIFVGVESHIESKKYCEEKEKYIRRSISFSPDIDDVVTQIVSSYTGLEGRHAKLCNEELKQFAKVCSIENIRVMKRILDDFVYVAGKVGDEATLSKVAKVLFYRIAPLANELATGELKPSDEESVSALKNVQTHRYAEQYKKLYQSELSQEKDRAEVSEQKSYAQCFIERYDNKLPIPWGYDECIFDYELDGDVDSELLKQTVQRWLPVMADKYSLSLDQIWDYKSNEDAELTDECSVVEEGLMSGRYNAEQVNLACALLVHFNKNGWISLDCDSMIQNAVQSLKERWVKEPDDYINPMILHNRQEDFLQPIVNAIQEETIRREKKSAEEEVSKFLTALKKKDKETVWTFLPQNQRWNIFDEIVKVGKTKEFCDMPNWALTLISVNLKDGGAFIPTTSLRAIEQIALELDNAIKVCDLKRTPLRKDRLGELRSKFAEILDSPEFKRVAEYQMTKGLTNG